jgi:Ni,Fe-hydrogenase I cytochrome b subunit
MNELQSAIQTVAIVEAIHWLAVTTILAVVMAFTGRHIRVTLNLPIISRRNETFLMVSLVIFVVASIIFIANLTIWPIIAFFDPNAWLLHTLLEKF